MRKTERKGKVWVYGLVGKKERYAEEKKREKKAEIKQGKGGKWMK